MEPGISTDLGVRLLTMRIGINSRGPCGLIRRALRMSALAGLAAGLMLAPGLMQAGAQAHGRGGHFGGGFGSGFGGRADHGFGPRGGGYDFNHGNRGRSGFGGWQNHENGNRISRNQSHENPGSEHQGLVNRGRANQSRGNFRGRPMQRGRGSVQGHRVGGGFNNGARGARSGQMQPRNGARPAMRQGPNGPGSFRPRYNPQPRMGRTMPGIRAQGVGARNVPPGQEHLPQWWRAHRELSPQQQADAMRREPGFRSLPRAQQQRLLGRLRDFDSRPPQVQQRMLSRVERFERLPPERQQEVRGASAAFSRMPPQRKQEMIRAFQQLRHIPPTERQQMLHSGYGQQFTPRERTILGNLLSIEPYVPSGREPYFGRPRQ